MAPVGNSAKIEDSLFYTLGQMTFTPTRRIAWPDIDPPFEPVESEIYLEPTVLWNETDRAEIGTGAPNRHMGIFQILTRGPIAISSQPQIELVDEIIAAFDRLVISQNSITVRIGSFNGTRSVPWRGSSFDEDGKNVIPISIPFWCDIFPS